MAQLVIFSICLAPSAAAATPSRPLSIEASTAAMTAPSTKGALLSSTRLTVPIRPRQDVDRMCRVRPGAMLDLHPAGLAIGQHGVAAGRFDGREQPAPDFHREIVLLDLDAERPRDATASLVHLFELDPRDEAQQPHRGVADPVRLQMTGGVIEQPGLYRLKVPVQLAGLVKHPEVFTDVVDARPHVLRAGDVEQMAVVMFEHQATRR